MSEDDRAQTPPAEEFLSVREVAQMLGVGPQAIYAMLRRGEMPGRRVGREWRVNRAQLLEWFRGGQTPADPSGPYPESAAPSARPRRRPNRST